MTSHNILTVLRNIVLLVAFFLLKTTVSHSNEILTYSGSIGNHLIYMEIEVLGRDRNYANARYFYKDQLRDILLSGFIENGKLTLTTDYSEPLVAFNEIIALEWHSSWDENTMPTGTWTQGKKSLPIVLSKPQQSDIHNNRIMKNPVIAKTSNFSDYQKIKLGLFKLASLDSVSYENGVKLRHFRETHTNIDLFRIDSGLVAKNLMNANYLLEEVHMDLFTKALTCTFGTKEEGYSARYSRLFISPNWISFRTEEWSTCSPYNVNVYENGVNLNTQTAKNVRLYELLQSGYTSSHVDFSGKFGQKLIDYFSKEHPEYFEKSAIDDSYESCDFTELFRWEECGCTITEEGLFIIPNFEGRYSRCMAPEWSLIPFRELEEFIEPKYYMELNNLKK